MLSLYHIIVSFIIVLTLMHCTPVFNASAVRICPKYGISIIIIIYFLSSLPIQYGAMYQ